MGGWGGGFRSGNVSGVGLTECKATNGGGGGRFVVVSSVKTSHGSGSEGGGRLKGGNSQELHASLSV